MLFGRHDLLFVSLFYVAFFVLVAFTGMRAGLDAWFLASLAVAALIAALLVFQCRDRDRGACFRAFVNNSWIGGVIFGGVLLSYLD